MGGEHAVLALTGMGEIQHAHMPLPSPQNVVRRSSSNGVSKPTDVPGPTTVVIQVGATGSGRWTDEVGYVADSVDCAVHVALQGPQQVKQQAQPARRTRRWWIKRLILAVILLGCILTAILVPYSLVVGLTSNLPREFKLLPPPARSHKIIFAFTVGSMPASSDSILPGLVTQITEWTVLASSGVHVASFSSRQAMQQAMMLLANTTGLKYAVADFQLLPDRRVSSVSDPQQLFELSRLQPESPRQHRRLQQHSSNEQQPHKLYGCDHHTSNSSAAGMHHSLHSSLLKAAQVSKLVMTHSQRLAERKAKRQQLLQHQRSPASIGLPVNSQDLKGWADKLWQESHPRTGYQAQQQQLSAAVDGASTPHLLAPAKIASSKPHVLGMQLVKAAVAVAGISTPDRTLCSGIGVRLQQRKYSSGAATLGNHNNASWSDFILQSVPTTREEVVADGRFSANTAAAPATAAGVSAGQSFTFQTQRRLQQYQPPPPPPQPQPQQQQALIHPQKGGKGTAWYLTDAGLRMQQAWDTTYGIDEVLVAVIDSGIELTQGGIGASVWVNTGETAGDNVDNDGNGFVDDVLGWDFGGSCVDAACSHCTPGPDSTDSTGWGTHAASVIAAQPEVTIGAAGIAPGVRVMALKVSDCREGSILGNAAAQQLDLGLHSKTADLGAASAGPTLLGSAAVQALNYALLNGAHVVLAAWQAGEVIGSGSNSSSISGSDTDRTRNGSAHGEQQSLDCMLGGAPGTVASSPSNCLATVQALLFQDVLRPLEDAGVLVITMYPDEDNSSSTDSTNGTIASAVLPCSLGLEFSNVLCVGSSRTVPATRDAVASNVPAQSYFDNIINTLGNGVANSTDANSTEHNSTSRETDEIALPEYFSNESNEPLSNSDQESNTITDVSGVVRTLLSHNPVQLRAPGRNILSGWAWGGHAVVTGGSAAAAVAAGAAALAWSNLGQTLGAEASGASAVEGLGQLVKRMMVEGSSTINRSSSKNAGTTAGLLTEQGVAGARNGGGTAGDLSILETLKLSSAFTGPLKLKPAHIGPAVTAVSNTLSYSWHISSLDSGPFDTPAMSFVARKALNHEAPFPLTDWEFFGYTALVEVDGYIIVPNPGNYSLAVVTADKYIMWVQGKWLRMEVVGEAGPALGLAPKAWVTNVLFTEAGYYKLRILIYQPGLSAFDLLWLPPAAPSFAHIPHFASFGRTQTLPSQLASDMTGYMLVHGSKSRSGGSSTLSSRINSEYSSSSSSSSGSNPVVTSSGGGSSVGSVVVTQQPTNTSGAARPTSHVGSADDIQASHVSSSLGHSSGSTSQDVGGNLTDSSAHNMQTHPAMYDALDAATTAAAAPNADEHEHQQSSLDGNSGWGSSNSGPSYGGSSSWGPWGSGGSGWGSSLGSFLDQIFPVFGWSAEKAKRSAIETLPDEYGTKLHSNSEYDNGAGSRGSSSSSIQPSSNGTQSNDRSPASEHRIPDAMQKSNCQRQQQQQQSPWHLNRLRSLLSTHWINPVVDTQVVMPLAGVFSVAMTLEDPWQYRTIIPSLKDLNLRRTGILPGPGLEVTDGPTLQQLLFGHISASDDRSGYGVIQGWLSWKSLNPGTEDWLEDLSGANSSGGGFNVNSSSVVSNSSGGEWGVHDGVQVSRSGVQFELTCGSAGVQQGCSLHVDGLIVAGSLGQPTTSTCILPARRPFGHSSRGTTAAAVPGHLLHLELLFATDAVRRTTLAVRARPCLAAGDGTVQVPSGSDGSFAVVTPAAGASAMGINSAAIASLGEADVSGGYMRGMLCTIKASVPGSTAGRDSSSSSSSSKLEKVVYLTVEQMRQAVAASYNLSAIEEQLMREAAADAAAAADSNTDTKAATRLGNSTDGTVSSNCTADSTCSNTTITGGSSNLDWVAEVDTHAEATTKAVLGVKGIAVAQLAPQWVAALPADTTYSFKCGCYWNGSWEGNLAVGVSAGSSGTAAMYLAGWPVDAQHLLPQYGPSDVYTPDYSTWQQRQQLASGGNAADPINWAGNSPGRGLGLAGLGVASDPSAAATLGYRPKQLSDGRMFTLGQVNGVHNLVVSPGSGWHQLLVVQGDGLQAWGSVVVITDVPGVEDINSSNSSRPYAPTKQGWLPGEWDAWIPR